MSDQEQPELFGFGVRLGIFLIVESATLSAIASASVLLYVALRALRRWRARRALRRQVQNDWVNSTQFSVAIQERTDATDSSFFVYLMMAELVQAVGGLLDIQWIIDAKVMPSALCTAQGALKQLGDVNVALTSLAIAVQTFCVLVLRFNFPAWISKYVIGAIFLFVTLVVGVSAAVRTNNPKGPYYGPSGYWCWINDPYKTEKIVLEYLWLWLAAFIMLILYGITALVMWGFLIVGDDRVDEGRWKLRWNWGAQRRSQEQSTQIEEDEEEDEERRQAKAIAKIMLFYPAVYTFCVFPVGLVRWLDFSGTNIPSAATLFASFVFQISGFLNSILYVSTRPELIRGGDSDDGSVEETRPARRKPSGNQAKRNPLEKKSTAEMRRTFGFLPDRDEDTLSRDRRSHNDHDSLPWYRTRHSRSDSGGTVHSNHLGPAIRRNSIVQPGLAFGDAADEHSPEFDFRDQHIYPLEELGQPSHLKIQRKPVHLDPGFLPEMEADQSAQLWHRPRHLHVQLPSTRHDRQHVDDQALSSYTLDTHSVSTHDAWKDHSSEGERSGPSDRPA